MKNYDRENRVRQTQILYSLAELNDRDDAATAYWKRRVVRAWPAITGSHARRLRTLPHGQIVRRIKLPKYHVAHTGHGPAGYQVVAIDNTPISGRYQVSVAQVIARLWNQT